MKNTVTAPPAGGAKYSFVGRPDFNRIIRENEGADVIIVSREDGLVTFLFKLGQTWTRNPCDTNVFRRAEKDLGIVIPFELLAQMDHTVLEPLPREWAAHWTATPGYIKDLRRIAQYIVQARITTEETIRTNIYPRCHKVRTGKHTVEVLPA